MARFHLSNKPLVAAWAAQAQPAGANTNGSLFFEGRVLYSYSAWWPIAILPRTPSHKARVNSSRYSPTSSRHASLARQAVGDYLALPAEQLREYIRSGGL